MRLSARSWLGTLFAGLLAFVSPRSARADLSPGVARLVEYETQANAIAPRSGKRQAIEHYEIPLSIVEQDVAERFPAEIRSALIFEREGQRYIRWIINPEDGYWHPKVKALLEAKGLSAERKTYFHGYATASRSYIIEDPVSGAEFSVKVSTDRTGGIWTTDGRGVPNKNQTYEDARQVRRMADHFHAVAPDVASNVIIMDEPAAFGLLEIDQAMLIRRLGGLERRKGRYFLPGFAALHEKVGAEIAKRHGGGMGPSEYWKIHYSEALGRALAEIAARLGVSPDSLHSQNFLIELDESLKPTGRIVLRDLGDYELLRPWFEARGQLAFLSGWPESSIRKEFVSVAYKLLHGTKYPPWMERKDYRDWAEAFFRAWEGTYSQRTGVPLADLQKTMMTDQIVVFSKYYMTSSPGWKKFFERLATQAPSTTSCASILGVAI